MELPELTWLEKLISVLAQTSRSEFEFSVGSVKLFLALPISVWFMVGGMALVVLPFGPNAFSNVLIEISQLFGREDKNHLYPDIVADLGWMGIFQTAVEVVGMLIALAVGYLTVEHLAKPDGQIPEIDVGLGWKIGSWFSFFILIVLPMIAAGKAANLISEYAPQPQPFERLATERGIAFSGNRLNLERTGSTVFYDTTITVKDAESTGRYFENIGFLRDRRASRIRVSRPVGPGGVDTIYRVELPIAHHWRDDVGLKRVGRMLAEDVSWFIGRHIRDPAVQVIFVSKDERGQVVRDTTLVVADTSNVQGYTYSVYRCCMYTMSR